MSCVYTEMRSGLSLGCKSGEPQDKGIFLFPLLVGTSAKLRKGPMGDVREWAELWPISITHEHGPHLTYPSRLVRPNVMNMLSL